MEANGLYTYVDLRSKISEIKKHPKYQKICSVELDIANDSTQCRILGIDYLNPWPESLIAAYFLVTR